LLLVVEGVFLYGAFDRQTLAGQHLTLQNFLLPSRHLILRASVVALAIGLLGIAWLRWGVWRRLGKIRSADQAWPYLLAHGACFLAVVWLLKRISGGEAEPDSPRAGTFALVLILGMAGLALWVAALVPAKLWLSLGWQVLVLCLLGTGVGLLAWRGGEIGSDLWRPLGKWTLWLVYACLHLFCRQPVCNPDDAIVGTPTFTVHLEDSCSGYEGVGLMVVFLGVCLWLFRSGLRFPQAWLLLPLGTLIIWLANAVRITAVILLGTWGSPALAVGGFHSQAGWLAFLSVGLGLVALASRLHYFTATLGPTRVAAATQKPTAAYLVPLLALLATMMLSVAFSINPDQFYPVRLVVVGAALWTYRHHYRQLRWRWSWTALGLGGAVFLMWIALESLRPTHGEAPTTPTAGLSLAVWLVCRVAGAVVTVPLAEELAFRGYLLRRLIAADFQSVSYRRFTWLSFVVSSVAFGLLHSDRWFGGVLAGMAYAVVQYRRGSLADAILAHAVTNALLAAYVLATGNWSLWT
jgi:exosortase E/protease (VPEID-CTERM system)